MFCTSCGSPIVAGQAVCSKCGSPTSTGLMQGGSGPRVVQHYRTLAVLTIIYSGLHAIGGLCALFAAKFIIPAVLTHSPDPNVPIGLIASVVSFVAWLLLIWGIAGLAGGIGLLSREPWARTVTLVVSFISLINVPLGTALGIYAIWVLLSNGADEDYRRLAISAGH